MDTMLRKLCITHTDLTEEDICTLENIEKTLPLFSKLAGDFTFIDCLTRDLDAAIVVAEAKGSSYSSLYKDSVVGKLALRQNEPAVLRTLQLGIETFDLKAVTQENVMVKQKTVPIKNAKGTIIGVLITEKDITDEISQNRNMEILSETTAQLSQNIMSLKEVDSEFTVDYNLLNDSIVIFDELGISLFANLKAEILYKKLGYKDNIVGMKFDNLALNEVNFQFIIKEKKFMEFETNVGNLSLQIKYAFTKTNHNYKVIMLVKNVTCIKEVEKELILKSVAIKEIHHRVKNNLQTIASILRLKSRRINSLEAKKSFQDVINRVLSIATVHEVLAQNGIDNIDIKNILSIIKNNAIRNGLQYNKNIKVELLGHSINVNSDKATSIAIIINELLENCVKHAFIEDKPLNIEIIIEQGLMFSNICLTDDGPGFDLNSISNDSLGLNIVNSIVKDKLNGHINIESNQKGTKIVFYFEN